MPRTATKQPIPAAPSIATLVIRIDTREQDPFTFASITMPILPFRTVRGTLPTGDYADDGRLLLPPADQAVVERKSLADLYGTLTRGRDRFRRECERMAEYGRADVVIEASYEQIMKPNEWLRHQTSVSPRSVMGTLIAWSGRYGFRVWTCPHLGAETQRRWAEQLTHRIIEHWARDHTNKQESKT